MQHQAFNPGSYTSTGKGSVISEKGMPKNRPKKVQDSSHTSVAKSSKVLARSLHQTQVKTRLNMTQNRKGDGPPSINTEQAEQLKAI